MAKRQSLFVALGALCCLGAASQARAASQEDVRFVVVDPQTHRPVPLGQVTIEDTTGDHATYTLLTGSALPGQTRTFNTRAWTALSVDRQARPTLITLPLGASITLQAQSAPPIKDIRIVVRASLLRRPAQQTASGEVRTQKDILTFSGGGASKGNGLVNNAAGAASDSSGQQHVRGEHAELAYVVDGVMLPDTLSGRQGAIVVPSTIENLEILTGGFAPEFGGQTAAILNITTLPRSAKNHADFSLEGGSYDTTNGDFTASGPIGKYAGYVVDVAATRTRNYLEPQQPDHLTAHNTGSDLNYFTKFRYTPGHRDTLTLTFSQAPSTAQLNNRTGLPDSFASAGQGFGFLGLRDRNGVRPDVGPDNMSALGAQTLALPSQQDAGQDITEREVNEFGTLSWQRRLSQHETSLLAVTLLHSGQDVHNGNPAVDLLNLPIDNSIEYNPTSIRNVHQVEFAGSITSNRGSHQYKTGLLVDDQYGNESYQIIPASQLALNELAALSPNLAPQGAARMDTKGNPIVDVNGNPVYVPSSGTSPTLQVHRSGFYRAAYAQDTWKIKRLAVNYGLRLDWFRQSQTLGQPIVDTADLSPRFNFSYTLDRLTTARWSYNRLFNIPPLAQGAIVGQPIEPETLDQYDVSLERQVGHGQDLKLAYYIKDIRNQVDTGLLIPGSQIGLYSAVNFQIGGVHGIEVSYNVTPPKGVGLDGFINYSYSIARPNGVDNTGANAPDFNDHDQRNSIGLGIAYNWKSGATVAFTLQHGSGLASSSIPPSTLRTPRTQLDLNLNSGPHLFRGRGGAGLSVENLLDDRTVINFQSGFSGTRFQQGRRVVFSLSGTF